MEKEKSFWVTLPGILTGTAGLITAIGGLLYVLFQVGMIDKESTTDTTIVPYVVGLSVETAHSTLIDNGLSVAEVRQEPTEEHATGTVISQSPTAGRSVATGTACLLIVASPIASTVDSISQMVVVPSVVGLPLETARTTLMNNDLTIAEVREDITESQESGTVISQRPPGGRTVDAGTECALVVARRITPPVDTAAAMVVVPSVVGLPFETARTTLANNELTVGEVREEMMEEHEPGTVVRQIPQPGQEVASGESCVLIVARSSTEVVVLRSPQAREGVYLIGGDAQWLATRRDPSRGSPEVFKLIHLEEGAVALQSVRSGKYVRAGLTENSLLGAVSNGIDAWEKFRLWRVSEGLWAFQSMHSEKFVRAGVGANSQLAAVSDHIRSWESFVL